MEIQNFKMRVTPEQSRIVQQTLFNNGYGWHSGSKTIQTENSPYLFFDEDFSLGHTDDGTDVFFSNHRLPELTFQEFFDRYVKWCVKRNEDN